MARSLIDVQFQINVFKKYKNEIFNDSGKAVPCSNIIYSILTKELNGMKAKAIQTSINRHASAILSVENENNPNESVTAAKRNDLSDDRNMEFSRRSLQGDNSASSCSHVDNDMTFDMTHASKQNREASSSDSLLDDTSMSAESLTIDLMNLYHPETSRWCNAQKELHHELNNIHKTVETVKKCFVTLIQETSTDQKFVIERLRSENVHLGDEIQSRAVAFEQRFAEQQSAINSLNKEKLELIAAEAYANKEVEKLRSENVHLGDEIQSRAVAFEQRFAEQQSAINSLNKEKLELIAAEAYANKEVEKLRSENVHLGDEIQSRAVAFEQRFAEQQSAINSLNKEKLELIAAEAYTNKEVEKLRSENVHLGDEIQSRAVAFEQRFAEQQSAINSLNKEKLELIAAEAYANKEVEKLRSENVHLGDEIQSRAVAFEQRFAEQQSAINSLNKEKLELIAAEAYANKEVEKLRSENVHLGDEIQSRAVAFEQRFAEQQSAINSLNKEKLELIAAEAYANKEVEKLRSENVHLGDEIQSRAVAFEQRFAEQQSAINSLNKEKLELIAAEAYANKEVEKLRSENVHLGDEIQSRAVAFEQRFAEQQSAINSLNKEKLELIAAEAYANKEVEKLRSENVHLGDEIQSRAVAFEQRFAEQQSAINSLNKEKLELIAAEAYANKEVEKLRSENVHLGDEIQSRAVAFEQRFAEQQSAINSLNKEECETSAGQINFEPVNTKKRLRDEGQDVKVASKRLTRRKAKMMSKVN